MNNTWNYINQRMSLRKPLGEALDVVEKLTDTLSLKKCDETNREQFIKEELTVEILKETSHLSLSLLLLV